jgi:hypothetical protein
MRTTRTLTLAIAVFTLVVLVGCGTTTTAQKQPTPGSAATTTGSDSNGGSSQDSTPPPTDQSARVGDTLVFSDPDSGVKLEITLVATKRLPKEIINYGYGMTDVAHGPLFGVKFKIKNVGDGVYDDSVSNCVALVTSNDQSVDPEWSVMDKNGDELAGQIDSVKISHGDVRQGWVFFKAPKGKSFRLVQFTPNSGWASQVGEWVL